MSPFLCVADGFDFRVRQSGAAMPAPPDDFAALDKDGSDGGIGRSASEPPPRQAQG
jgi:hypothetical protein